MNEKKKPQEAPARTLEALDNNIGFDYIKNIPSTLPGCFGEYHECFGCSVRLQCARTSARDD